MTDWNTRMLAVASVVAGWSKDPSTQVGAVIADGSHRIVSQGYNGLARGVTDDPEVLADRDEKLRRTIHAEMNAVLFADRRSLMGCTIYVTHPPCARCAAVLIQVGIARVVSGDQVLGPRWLDDLISARHMFAEAGVHTEVVPMRPSPQATWQAIVEEADAEVHHSKGKRLIFTEDMCVRLGGSLGL